MKLFSKAVNWFKKASLIKKMIVSLTLCALGFVITVALFIGYMLKDSFINDFLQAIPSDYPVPPHEIKVDLSKKGNVYETTIRTRREKNYRLQLFFKCLSYDIDYGVEKNQILTFLGDQYNKGTRIPLKITIKKLNENGGDELVADKNYLLTKASSWGDGMVAEHIYVFSLERGVYYIRLETLEDFPFLEGREVYFHIDYWIVK